jgi:hypothetical protein
MKIPYSGRDLLLIGIFLVLTTLGAVGSFHTGKVDFGVWFFGLGTVVALFRPVLRRRPVYTAGRPQKTSQKTVSRNERVEFDEREVRRYLSDGRTESIAWEDIDEIDIVTTDEGPWVDDLFWLFIDKERSKGCAVSNQADGFKDLLHRIQRLPGFDNAMVVQAMGSTSNRSFVVWKNPVARSAS